MPITYPYTQYGGLWNLSAASKAKGAGTWPVPPEPFLYAWGVGNGGALGFAAGYVSSPVQVGTLTNWSVIAIGGYDTTSSCSSSVKTDGTLWSWGDNAQGQLGLGNTTAYSSPKQIGALTTWSTVSLGYKISAAITTTGQLYAWGYNNVGQLGLGDTTDRSSPVQVGSLTTWLKVSAGGYHMAAIKTDGTIWVWGGNNTGALGIGNTTNYSSPKQIGALTNWANISCASQCTVAVKTDGTMWSWGKNTAGNLGIGNRTSYSSPKQIGSLTDWSQIANGGLIYLGEYVNCLAVKTNGTLWAWGKNTYGDLGLGNSTSYSSPKQVGSLTDWLKVSSGYNFGSALKTDGTLWAWGRNNAGQLGINNTTNYSSPKQIGISTTWKTLATGTGYHNIAILNKTP
jgi:alpha-tubulin suppressor-like RCC1 family protein